LYNLDAFFFKGRYFALRPKLLDYSPLGAVAKNNLLRVVPILFFSLSPSKEDRSQSGVKRYCLHSKDFYLKMAREKDPKNIFEAAGSGKKESEEKGTFTTFEEIFSRCQKMHEEIANTLDENLERSKITPSAIRSYISRPQNFSQKDWKRVEEQKKKNEEMLKELTQKISHREISEIPEEKGKPKKGKKKRKPMTKRRWLKMG
jgi:predicted transcriptional regulator